MENSTLTILAVILIPAIFGFLMKLRNDRYEKSGGGAEAQLSAEAYARRVMQSDETLVMVDYPHGGCETVVLTDKGVYHAKKGETVFRAAYADIAKVTCQNFGGDKVPANGNVFHIIIKAADGRKTKLYSFVHAADLALELDRRTR